LYDELKELKIQQAVGKKFEQIKERTPVDNYLTMAFAQRPERAPGAATGPVQPASATSAQSRPAPTTGAAPRAPRN
jgi:hypothetical protein